MQHHFRNRSGHVHLRRHEIARAIGQRVDQPRHTAIDTIPIVHGGALQTGLMRHRGQMQNQVRRTAEGRVNHHRIVDGLGRDHVARGDTALHHLEQSARRTPSHVQPHRMTRRRQRRMRKRHAQGLAHHLRCGGGSQKLTAAAGRSTSAASRFSRILQRHVAVRIPRSESLRLTRVFAAFGGQRHAARRQDRRQIVHGRQRHHHRRQALVAGGDADHTFARGQRTHQAPQHHRRVIAERQTVEHPGRALAAAIAGIGAVGGKWHRTMRRQFPGRSLHQQIYFEVAGVQAKRDRLAVGFAQPTVRG